MSTLPPGFELETDYDSLFRQADEANGLPPGMTRSIAEAETGFLKDWQRRNRARSPAGAIGPMQFMPATGQRFGLLSEADLTDPNKAIPAAGQYLGQLYREFGRPELAAAAYNAGEGAVRKYGGIPPYKETQKYVPRVMKNLASVAHAQTMLQKYSPSLAQRTMDFFVPPAYGADQPQGAGVMEQGGVPPGFDIEQVQSVDLPPGFELEQPQQSGMSPDLQTAFRSTAKGLSAPVTMAMDAVNAVPNLIAYGVNKVASGTMDYIPPAQGYVDAGLRAGGINPEPQSGAERAVTAGLGAAVGAPMFGAASLASAPTQALGAAASSAAASAGLPLPVQIAAGMAPSMGGSAVNAVVSGAKRTAAPFTTGGKESIAGRILNKQAAAPSTALQRAQTEELSAGYLPGSTPTLAEVTQDPGLARLQRVLPSSKVGMDAGVDQVNALRITQLDDAIHEVLNRVNKVPKGERGDVVDAIGQVKQRIGTQFEEQLAAKGIDTQALPVPPSQTVDRLRGLMRKHEGNTNLENIIRGISTQIGDEAPSFNKLWNMRQALDDAIYEKWAVSSKASQGDLKRLGEQIRGAMNADLVAAVPEFQPFLSRYARMARAEGRLNLGRKLGEKVENTARNIAGDGEAYGSRTVSGAKLDNLDVAGAEKRAGAKLSKAQRAAFNAAREEKRRANILTTGGAPGNSNTAQNQALDQLIADDILGGLLGDKARSGFAGWLRNAGQTTAGGAVGLLTRSAQSDIMRMVAAGLIDPKEGARLMQLGQLRSTADFASKLKQSGQQGLLSEIYSNMVR